MRPQKWKLGTVRAGQDVAWSYPAELCPPGNGRSGTTGDCAGRTPRWAAARTAALLPEPLWVLYVLVTPRSEAAAGRYQSATPHTREEVLALLDRFEKYFACDGRHNLWLAAPPAGQLVLDRHEVIYAYGPIAEIVARLKEKDFAEVEMIRVPVPHSHHFHEEMDAEERGDAGALGVGAVGVAGDGRSVEGNRSLRERPRFRTFDRVRIPLFSRLASGRFEN